MFNLFLDTEEKKEEKLKKRFKVSLERKETPYNGNSTFEIEDEILSNDEEKPKLIIREKNNINSKKLF